MRIGELCPIERRRRLGRIFVPRKHGERRRMLAMRHRNSGVRRHGQRRADSGNDFERDAGATQRLRLFAAASEDERIAALQANDPAAALRLRNHQRFDLGLRHCVFAGAFADENALAAGRRQRDDRIACQARRRATRRRFAAVPPLVTSAGPDRPGLRRPKQRAPFTFARDTLS